MLLGYVSTPLDASSWYQHHLPNPYDVTDYRLLYGFWFTPPVAYVFFPFTLLPWPAFCALLTALEFTALGYLLGRWAFLGLLVPPIWWEIMAGNVALFMAVAVVVGMRRPGAWAAPLLLKVTPGIGLVWFALRREWHSLGLAMATTAVIAGASLVVAPHLWFEWLSRMIANFGDNGPGYFVVPLALVPRLAIALLVLVWGARTDRQWTVAVAATLGTPVLWFNALALLAAVPCLMPGRPAPWGGRRATRLRRPDAPRGAGA